MTNKPIPTFIIEEHHEAFVVWNYAIQHGMIPPTGNTLFHVDEHSDMGTPRFNRSIHELNGDIKGIKNFALKELDIGGFIIPSIYMEIYNKVFWIKQKHRRQIFRGVGMYVRSYNREGKKLISDKINIKGNIADNNGKWDGTDSICYRYYKRTIEKIPSSTKVILDIDLDYFSCSGNPNELEEIYIEITKDEYNDYQNNLYHRLNFFVLGKKIHAKETKGKYYYVINQYNEIYPCDLKVNKKEISKRIDSFTSTLKQKKIQPLIVNICRSRHSGFTPSDQWNFIEEMLLSNLNAIYNVKHINI